MKILIIGFAKIKYMPYLNLYLDNIDVRKNDVHLVYWDRLSGDDATLPEGITAHAFNESMRDDIPKHKKIQYFIHFKNFVEDIIKKEKFDFIISLTSVVSVLLLNTLTKKYKDKYIFDYRDYTYESFYPYKKAVGMLVKNSFATFVSSDAFRRFLPAECENKIFTTHNFIKESLSYRNIREEKCGDTDTIRVSFWGFIRDEDVNIEIVKKLGKDSRFSLNYYGRQLQTAKNLKEFADKNGFENVFFYGEYTPEERYEFVKNTDIIHNIYSDINSKYLMSNKYYDGIIFRIPQACMSGSFMGRRAMQNGVGIELNPFAETFADDLYEYYKGIDSEKFRKNCDDNLADVVCQTDNISKIIRDLFN